MLLSTHVLELAAAYNRKASSISMSHCPFASVALNHWNEEVFKRLQGLGEIEEIFTSVAPELLDALSSWDYRENTAALKRCAETLILSGK